MKEQNASEKQALTGRKFWVRLILVLVLIGIAVSAFTVGVGTLFSAETGYRTVESTATNVNCASEFVFTYHLGVSGISPTAELKAITALYSEKTVSYYRLFHPTETFEGIRNVASLNQSVNTTLTLPEDLYSALERAVADPGRNLYLGPVFAYYETLFASSYDEDAATWDPSMNADLAREIEQTLRYLSDDTQIRLELLPDHCACLHVSDEYLAYAKQIGIDRFIDFYWLKNAYIADLLARDLTSAGYTRGVISSRDGFIRNFDVSDTEYAFDVFYDRSGALVHAGKLTYSSGAAICSLHPFALDELEDELYCYRYADGTRVTRYLSIEDGLCRKEAGAVVAFSKTETCVDLLYGILPYYLENTLSGCAPANAGLVYETSAGMRHFPAHGFTWTEN